MRSQFESYGSLIEALNDIEGKKNDILAPAKVIRMEPQGKEMVVHTAEGGIKCG